MQKRKRKWIGAALLCAFTIAACGKEAGTKTPGGGTGTEIPGGDSGTVTAVPGNDTSNDAEAAPKISFEVLTESEKDAQGGELIRAQYPVFSVSGEGYEALAAALASLNEEWKGQADTFLADMKETAQEYQKSVDSSYLFRQDVNANITRCDQEIVSILVTRSVEEGGPHPNNDFHSYNFDAKTGEVLRLSDVVAVDDALKEKIKAELYANYPELEFDEALLETDIQGALTDSELEWYFMDGQICIGFKEGSFGFGHAEGSLGVLIPVEK